MSTPVWLTVTPTQNVDQNGLGDYDVSIDQSLLSTAEPTVGAILTLSYTATVNSTVTNGSLDIPLMVYQRNFVADAGYQYVLLFDASVPNWWQNAVGMAKVGLVNGKYSYRLTNVAPGNYYLSSGADLNANGVVCDVGEACGYYPIFGRLQQITVPDSKSNIQGLDFAVGYYLLITNSQLNKNKTQPLLDSTGKGVAQVPVTPQTTQALPEFLP